MATWSGGDLDWLEDAWQQGSRFLVNTEATYNGRACLALVSDHPNDVRWVHEVTVETRQDYVLSGWIRTPRVTPSQEPVQAGAHIGQLMREERTAPLFGTWSWQHVERHVNSRADQRITIACCLVRRPSSGEALIVLGSALQCRPVVPFLRSIKVGSIIQPIVLGAWMYPGEPS